jgi:hypothetical protein
MKYKYLFICLFFYSCGNNNSSSNIPVDTVSSIQSVDTNSPTNQTIIEDSRLVKERQEQELKSQKSNEEKEKIMGCLIGDSFKGVMGTYSFSSNGVFSYEQQGVYAGYWEGRWKYSGSNKIKINKSWLNENCCYTITVSKYCEVFNLDGLN